MGHSRSLAHESYGTLPAPAWGISCGVTTGEVGLQGSPSVQGSKLASDG